MSRLFAPPALLVALAVAAPAAAGEPFRYPEARSGRGELRLVNGAPVLLARGDPDGKRAFASVTYPGMLGCVSGINDAGLAVADLTVTDAADGSPKLDPGGVPYTLALRRVLEECATVEEAERLLRSLRRTVRQNVAVCDRTHGAVFEITPRTLAVRRPDEGVCACTNHFRTAGL